MVSNKTDVYYLKKMSVKSHQPSQKVVDAHESASAWELSLESRYSEEDILSIMNMLSYWENKRRGYGTRNDKELYWEERCADKNNILYNEAMCGLALLESGRKRKMLSK